MPENPTLLVKLADDKFDIHELVKYRLILQICDSELQINVVGGMHQECLLLEHYCFEVSDSCDIITQLPAFFEKHLILKNKSWKTLTLSVKNECFSLIPSKLLIKDQLGAYLRLLCEINPESMYFYHQQVRKEMCNVFGVEKEWVDFFLTFYTGQNVKIVHQVNTLLEGAGHIRTAGKAPAVFLFLEKNKVWVIVKDGKKLVYCNAFSFEKGKHCASYIMMVIQELRLDQYASQLFIWGNIAEDTKKLMSALSKYMAHVSLGKQLPLLRPSQVTEAIENHQYFDLLGLGFLP